MLVPTVGRCGKSSRRDDAECWSLFFRLKDAPGIWRETFESDKQGIAAASCLESDKGETTGLVYYLVVDHKRTKSLMMRVELLPQCSDGVAVRDGAELKIRNGKASVGFLSQGGMMTQAWFGWLAEWMMKTHLKREASYDAALTKIPTDVCPENFNNDFSSWYEESIQRAYRRQSPARKDSQK
jgi:hypothetical protein